MQKAKLVVVGEGPSRALMEGAIREASLQSRVALLGSRNDVPDMLRMMDVFVLPSLAEGISNTILEAMATGIPVIATRVGGNADLVEDGRTGRLVNAGDWNAMAEHIIAYASDSETTVRHGQAARKRAEQEFGLDAMVQNYASLYDRLTGQGNQVCAGDRLRSTS
jgi:glycosyltransferase involved in cell wall biosynthesis